MLRDVELGVEKGDENRWNVAERRALDAGRSPEPTGLSTEYTDTWRGSRGRVRCIWTGRANLIIYSSLFDLPIDRYFRAETPRCHTRARAT